MIAQVGEFALVLALIVAVFQVVLPLIGVARGDVRLMESASGAAQAQLLFLTLALVALATSFVNDDFGIEYIALNSNAHLPVQYKIAAVWGGHEGSLLLWVFMLGVWTLAVAAFSKSMPPEFRARVLAVMGMVTAGFLAFTLFTSNPFARVDQVLPPGFEGRDLNPLLQDPGLIFHPPMLYMGYVGFSVAFAFAMAALMSGKLDAAWSRWSRPWTLAAWIFLTCGITLGSVWAYYELGWGGWWFWDPVENASFMPWLMGTALIHSLAVTEKRGELKNWTVLLAIFTFALSLLGTFLVRSGVLTSVHAFASDPSRGVFILILLAVVVGGSLTVFAFRAPKMSRGSGFDLVSRETTLVFNNALLVTAAATVLLGTLTPLGAEALGAKISVGPQWFDPWFSAVMAPLVILMGIGPTLRWRRSPPGELKWRLAWPLVVSIALGVGMPLLFGEWIVWVGIAFLLAGWLVLNTLQNLWTRAARNGIGKLANGLRLIPRSFYGMTVAHLGVAVFIIGAVVTSNYSTERDLRVTQGQSVSVGGYDFRFDGIQRVPGPNYTAARATVQVTRDGAPVTVLYPEKRVYRVQTMPMTEAAIDAGVLRHLYVSLGDDLGGGAWSVRVYHKPMIGWIWYGTLTMAIGGLLAATDRRYRLAAKRAREAQPQVGGAAVAHG